MTARGRVSGGVVVLDEPGRLPEGAEVRVVLTARHAGRRKRADLGEKLRRWAGRAKGLPADLARNHDHYLYGTPKT